MSPETRPRTVPHASLGCAALLLGALGPAAYADEGGFYVGANVGDTLATYRRSDLDNAVIGAFAAIGEPLVLSDSSARNAHLPWSADVGYRFSAHFSLEASYIQLATLEYLDQGTAGSAPASSSLTVKSHGPALALVGVLPMLDNWGLEAQLGAYQARTATGYVISANGGTSTGTDAKSSTSLLAGIGLQYLIGAHWVARLNYTHLNRVGEKILDRPFNVDLLSGGITYAF